MKRKASHATGNFDGLSEDGGNCQAPTGGRPDGTPDAAGRSAAGVDTPAAARPDGPTKAAGHSDAASHAAAARHNGPTNAAGRSDAPASLDTAASRPQKSTSDSVRIAPAKKNKAAAAATAKNSKRKPEKERPVTKAEISLKETEDQIKKYEVELQSKVCRKVLLIDLQFIFINTITYFSLLFICSEHCFVRSFLRSVFKPFKFYYSFYSEHFPRGRFEIDEENVYPSVQTKSSFANGAIGRGRKRERSQRRTGVESRRREASSPSKCCCQESGR